MHSTAFLESATKENLAALTVREAIETCVLLEHLRKVQEKNGEAGLHKIAVISFSAKHSAVVNAILKAGDGRTGRGGAGGWQPVNVRSADGEKGASDKRQRRGKPRGAGKDAWCP